MDNDTTLLRFDADRISINRLYALTSRIEAVANLVAETLTGARQAYTLDIVASPARGSIIFVIQPVLNVTIDVDSVVRNLSFEVKDWAGHLVEAATVGSFLWMLAFGPKTLPELLSGKPKQIPRDTPEDVVLDGLLRVALKDATLLSEVKKLANAAAATEAARVEIQIRDERPVLLWSASDRMVPGIIGRLNPHFGSGRIATAQYIVRPHAGEVATVRYRGEVMPGFFGDLIVNGAPSTAIPAVILWGSKLPVPQPTSNPVIEVRGEEVTDLSELAFQTPLPESFERAQVVYYVFGAADYR